MSDESSPIFVIVGNPASRRVELFQAALSRMLLPGAKVVAWADLLAGRVHLAAVVRAGDVVRLESPGRDFDVEKAILVAGADEEDDENPPSRRYDRISRQSARELVFDKGRILYPRQWFLGFRSALRKIAAQLADCPLHRLMNLADDVQVMFDKCHCHATLLAANVEVPPSIGPVGSFDELIAQMRKAGWKRAFIKLAHGSSASGVVAYQFNAAGHHLAITTVETVRENGELRLYNSRRIKRYDDPRQIAELIDALARHRVHVEKWLPKAGIHGKVFDLRVVVIGGRARHAVARLSESPMTNLHLLNERADASIVRQRMGEEYWNAAMSECEKAMKCFPGSLHGGVDLLIGMNFRDCAILEVNAFGDLLPGVLWHGVDTYEAEIAEIRGHPSSPCAECGGEAS